MAKSARRRSEAVPLHKSAQRRPLIFRRFKSEVQQGSIDGMAE
jgi:hypothetical protein